MAFIPLPDGIKIEIKYRKNGALVVNVMWGTTSATVDLTFLQNVAEAVQTWWTSIRDDQCATSIALEEVVATDVSVADGLQYVNVVTPAASGTNAGADLPSNVAAVVSLYTGYAGRSFRGRQYWCGLPDTALSGNTIQAAYLAVMVADMGELITALQAEGCNPVVASFQHNGAPRATGLATIIDTWGANNVVDTQRRRIPKVFS